MTQTKLQQQNLKSSVTTTQYNPPYKPDNALRLIVASDTHLGHKRVPASEMTGMLDAMCFNPAMLETADGIIIPGDLFDRLLNLPLEASHEITEWIYSLLQRCVKHKVALRILEGTPSHDWCQSKLVLTINKVANIGADVKYFDDLAIDYDETLGLTIGYVPDEIRETYEHATKAFGELLVTRGLAQVDLLVSHGFYEFQVPKIARLAAPPGYDSEKFSRWVKYLILNGHDHIHKSSGKIVVPGQPYRTKHGETEDKGFVIVDIFKDEGIANWKFIVNDQARRYDSIDICSLDDDDAKIVVDDKIAELQHYRNSSLAVNISERCTLGKYINSKCKEYDIAVKVTIIRDVKDCKAITDIEMTERFINITAQTIEQLILDEISSHTDISNMREELSKTIRYIKEQ